MRERGRKPPDLERRQMKDKTHSMNRGFSAGEAEQGFEKIPNSEMSTRRDRKMRQLGWANLEDNEALMCYENMEGADEDYPFNGFLPRNNYEDRS